MIGLSPCVKEFKTVLDPRFDAVDSGGQVLDSSLCQWNLDSGFQSLVDSGILELFSRFQSPGFRILRVKFSRIPDSKSKNFPDSGLDEAKIVLRDFGYRYRYRYSYHSDGLLH